MKSNLWLVEPGLEDQWRRVRVLKCGKRPVFGLPEEVQGKRPVAQGKVRTVAGSHQAYLLREEFPKVKPNILLLQINDRAKQIGLWPEGTKLLHCSKVLSQSSGSQSLAVLFMPEPDIIPIFELARSGLKLEAIIPEPAAIAGLLGAITPKPVLVALILEGRLQLLIVQDKTPIHLQMVPMDTEDLVEEPLLVQTLALARQSAQSNHGINIELTVALGPKRGLCPKSLEGQELWTPDWNKILDIEDVTAVECHPALFGAHFVDPAFDLVPPSWHWSWRIQDVSRWASLAMAGGALALGMASAALHYENAALSLEHQRLYAKVLEQKEQLEKVLPDSQEKDMVEKLAAIWEQNHKEPRLDRVLINIINALPPLVKISHMEIERGPMAVHTDSAQATQVEDSYMEIERETMAAPTESAQATGETGGPETLLNHTILMSLKLNAKGKFEQVRSSLDKSAAFLARQFALQDLQLDYWEDKEEGCLSCRLLVHKPESQL